MTSFESGESASIISVTDKVRAVRIGAAVSSVHFLGDDAIFVGAEENVFFESAEGQISTVPVHGGGILCAASDGSRIVMGGDDGKLVALDAKGEVTLISTDAKRRWIDNVALHPDGAVAHNDALRQRIEEIGVVAAVVGRGHPDKHSRSMENGLVVAAPGLRSGRTLIL